MATFKMIRTDKNGNRYTGPTLKKQAVTQAKAAYKAALDEGKPPDEAATEMRRNASALADQMKQAGFPLLHARVRRAFKLPE